MSKMDLINRLIGQKFQSISRCCELVCFSFGSLLTIKDRNNEIRAKAKYAIHTLCPFRVVKEKRIVLCSDDLFISDLDDDCIVDLGKTGGTAFDRKAELANESLENEYINSVIVNELGDLTIVLKTTEIQLFVSTPDNQEAWRFFDIDSHSHLVVYGNGIEFQRDEK